LRETRYVEAAERAVRLFAPAMARSPAGFSTMLAAEAALLTPPTSVLLAGAGDECRRWQRTLAARVRPSVRVFNVAGIELPAGLAKGAVPADRAVAWVCQGTQCLPAIDDLHRLEQALASGDRP
jgi:uncharacterized protein YyaL (SSP411 family)